MSAVASLQTFASTPQPMHERRVVRLWLEDVREAQMDRFCALHEIQSASEVTILAAEVAHHQAKAVNDALPLGSRFGLPTAPMFAKVFGFLRSGATLKDPMLRVELSVKEIAARLRISVSTVKQVLRWLGCGPIKYKGVVVAHGLRYLHRARRVAKGRFFGKEQSLYRTSVMVLTKAGRGLLSLPLLGDDPLGMHTDDGAGEESWQDLQQRRVRERRKRYLLRRTAERVADVAQRRAGMEAMQRAVQEMANEGRPHPLERLKLDAWSAAKMKRALNSKERVEAAQRFAAQDAKNDDAMRVALASVFDIPDGDPPDKTHRRRQT